VDVMMITVATTVPPVAGLGLPISLALRPTVVPRLGTARYVPRWEGPGGRRAVALPSLQRIGSVLILNPPVERLATVVAV
jgi:hypothetical protein